MTLSSPTIAARVAALPTLSIAELWAEWDRYFARRPKHSSRSFLESRVAYQIQAEAYGGVPPATKARLIALGQQHSKILPRSARAPRLLVPGTVLIREHGDREHRVTVQDDGTFLYERQVFRSLSAVARHIAGTPWSGPAFFGLKGGKRR